MFFDKFIDFEKVIYLPIQVSKTHITAMQKSAPRAIHRADHKRERKKQKISSKTFVRSFVHIQYLTFVPSFLLIFVSGDFFLNLLRLSWKDSYHSFAKKKKNAFHMSDPNYPWYHDRFLIFNTKINH